MKGTWGTYGRKSFPVDERGVEFKNSHMNVKDSKGGSRVLTITGLLAGGMECTQGALNVDLIRASSSPFTSALWGGAEDIATRITVSNSGANTSAYGGMKALRVYVRNYSGGQICNMQGAEISWDDRGSGGSNGVSVANGYGLLVTANPNGVVSTSLHSLIVEDTGQGTVQATNYNNSLLHLRTAGGVARASGAVPVGISFEKGSGSSGITAALGFASTNGSEGCTAVANSVAGSGERVKVRINVNGTAYYVLAYDTIS
jgi:hypothetical protein